MSTQYISSQAVIGKVFRDFKPQNASFEIDAIEWIAEALDEMRLEPCYVPKTAKLIITDHRVKIPCDVLEIKGIKVNEVEGNSIGQMHMERYNGDSPIERVSKAIGSSLYRWYEQRNNFLHFKFEQGKGYIYYDAMPVDDCGYPLIPDDARVTNALGWYILKGWLAQGNKHPVFDYEMAEQRWMAAYPRAQNSVKELTPEKMAKVLHNWVQLVPRINRQDDFFTEQQYYFNHIVNADNIGGFPLNPYE